MKHYNIKYKITTSARHRLFQALDTLQFSAQLTLCFSIQFNIVHKKYDKIPPHSFFQKPKTHDIHFIIIIKNILQPKDNTDKAKTIKIEFHAVISTSFTLAMK